MAQRQESGGARDRSFSGRCKRFMVRYAAQVLLLTAGSTGFALLALIAGVFTAPGKLQALSLRADRGEAQRTEFATDIAELKEAVWTMVAMQCLRMDDSTFVSTRLKCGRAFRESGVARELRR